LWHIDPATPSQRRGRGSWGDAGDPTHHPKPDPSVAEGFGVDEGILKRLIPIVCWIVLAAPAAGQEAYIPTVELIERDNEWFVLRDGETTKLHGAGVSSQQAHLLDFLASKGGVVTRTWGTKNIGAYLDRAHKNGVGVIVGFWMGHERHGFNYANAEQVAEQLANAQKAIQQYKDHPAVLMWSVGNEVEANAKDVDLVYHAMSDIVAVVKDEDDRRPVITVVAEISKEKVRKLNRIVPWLDGLGINSYGGIKTLGRRVTEYGWKKPFIVTEYGPRGAWDAKKTAWRAPLEPTSSQKAAQYGNGFDAVASHPQCIGTIAFIWGWKSEATPTWFGMFLEDGSRLGAVDVLQKRWTEKGPRRRAPVIKSLVWLGDSGNVRPGSTVTLVAETVAESSDRLKFAWSLMPEKSFRKSDVESSVEAIEGTGSTVSFIAPDAPGAYRLAVIAKSRRRTAATANIPFRVVED